jgi:hypothetical protein
LYRSGLDFRFPKKLLLAKDPDALSRVRVDARRPGAYVALSPTATRGREAVGEFD